jgi:hypothetical protein
MSAQSGASSHSSAPFAPNSVPTSRCYTVLSMQTSDPFGFGSADQYRFRPRPPDTPGPGRYEPHPGNFHIESLRGRGLGFTSLAPRKLGFTRGTKNPAPSSYTPQIIDRRITPKIGPSSGPLVGARLILVPRRCSCYPDERESSSTPGPGSYDAPSLVDLASTSVFKSRTERIAFPTRQKQKPRFDGRTFVLQRSEL